MYVSSRIACKELGVHPNTLRNWAKKGSIDFITTPNRQRKFNTSNILKKLKKTTIGYCRVSSAEKQDDLNRQVETMQITHPKAEIITDIENENNLKTILDRSLKGEGITLVVTDRNGLDIVEWLISRNGGKIVVLDKSIK